MDCTKLVRPRNSIFRQSISEVSALPSHGITTNTLKTAVSLDDLC